MTSEYFLKRKLLRKPQRSSIIEVFVEEFENVFISEEPSWEEIESIFDWLEEEAKCAICFADIKSLARCRRLIEAHFSKLQHVRKKVWKKSKAVRRRLMKRFEELRTTRKSTKGKVALIEGCREEEKVPPSE